MDSKTHLSKIHDAADSIHSGWLARPPLGDPRRARWEDGCRDEVRKLKELIREVKEPLAVPPLVLAFLLEHNRAVSARQPSYNYEAINPDNSIQKVGSHFTRDDKYRVRLRKSGWWTDLESSDGASGSKESGDASTGARANAAVSSAGRTGEHPSDCATPAPRKRDASTAGMRTNTESVRSTRARSRALADSVAPPSAPEPPAPRQPVRRGPAAPKTAPPATPAPSSKKLGKPTLVEHASAPPRDVSESPAPSASAEVTWDPASEDIVDDWLISRKPCKRCKASGHTCRVNLVHGVACNRCTNASVGCSFAAKQPRSGPHWTYDQRRWILVDWARHAKADTAYPSEVHAKFKIDFDPPQWFIQGLQAARAKETEPPRKRVKRARAASPVAQKRRGTTAPATESDEDAPNVKPATSGKRRRSKRAKGTTIKEDVDEDYSESEAEDPEAADTRAIKRPRTDSRASSAVPQPQRPWKYLRNVEHMLRARSATVEAHAQQRDIVDPHSGADVEYAPDFDQELDDPTVIPQQQQVSRALAHPPSSFLVISDKCTVPQLVDKINANNEGFDARLAAVWEALGRQQMAHDTFREEARREIQELKNGLSASQSQALSVTRERDVVRQDALDKESEIKRLQAQVLALQARLEAASSPTPMYRPVEDIAHGSPWGPQFPPAKDSNTAGSSTPTMETMAVAVTDGRTSSAVSTQSTAQDEHPVDPPAPEPAEMHAEESANAPPTDARDEQPADARDQESTETQDEQPADARDEESTNTRDEQTADARRPTGDPVEWPTGASGQTQGPEEQATESRAERTYQGLGDMSKQSPGVVDEPADQLPADILDEPLVEAGSVTRLSAARSPSPPSPISAGLGALSQYSSSDSDGAGSTRTSRAASLDPCSGSVGGGALSTTGPEVVLTGATGEQSCAGESEVEE